MTKDLFGNYKLVLGLEIHLHLKTDRKMFCRCGTDVYGKEPNTHTCPTCLGLPGALPVPNAEAVRKTQILGLALNSEINKSSRFDRKHYFYPDLPKGYQISQYEQPLCVGGYLALSSGRKAEIERVHLEEDTAKSIHENGMTQIDFNLSSMPLVEIVTKPTFTTIEDAEEFGRKIQMMVRELGLGDADMEKGQMRLEPNISLRTPEMEQNNELPDYKVEIKNINSFRFMKKAVEAEVIRQRNLLEKGEQPIQENRGYYEDTKTTVSQRSKEHAHDYRYFPEPDIPPMEFDDSYINEVKEEYSKLKEKMFDPENKVEELIEKDALTKSLAKSMVSLATGSSYHNVFEEYEKLKKETGHQALEIANLLVNRPEYRGLAAQEFVQKIKENNDKISDENVLSDAIQKAIDQHQDAVESYRLGKENALQFLVGMVMKETKGKADAEMVKDLLTKEID